MKTAAFALILTLGASAQALAQPVQGASMNAAPIVYVDIAGDTAKLASFYETVFGWRTGQGSPYPQAPYFQPLPVLSPLPAGLRGLDTPDDPQTRKVIYIGVDDVTQTLSKVTSAGGTVHAPRFEVKGVVVLGLFRDPSGNLMGLVEMKDGRPKVP